MQKAYEIAARVVGWLLIVIGCLASLADRAAAPVGAIAITGALILVAVELRRRA